MSENPGWRFPAMRADQKHVEPTHREHLAPGGLAEPLVREAIQNSLDVTEEGQITKVAFTLGSIDPIIAEPYFEDLRPHLEVATRSLPEGLPQQEDSIPFLTIEDYNTTGLVGDPGIRNEENPDGTKNHFFRFWHRVGPANEFKRRGSWGVGKVVFSNASRIRTFFGVTFRDDDSSALLMGEAGLNIHTLNDVVHDWYGYYAIHEPALVPIQGEATSHFTQAFSLSRTTPGLSIVVPYLREDVKLTKLAGAVIEHYFLPILAGRLEVTLREGSQIIEITRSTIDDIVTQLKWPPKGPSRKEEMSALLSLARWQIDLPLNEYVLLATAGVDGSYKLTKECFPKDSLASLSAAFAANNRIAFRVPVVVKPKEGSSGEEEVRLVVERDESLRTSNVPHLRSGINISKMRSQGSMGVRGLLVIGVDPEQGLLDKLLQASEGPAHINWEAQGEGYDKAKSLYSDAHKIIPFMRGLVRTLVDLLATPQDDRDTRTLSPFFPDYMNDGYTSGGTGGKKKGPGPGETKAPPPPPPGVIEGIVKSIMSVAGGLQPVEAATTTIRALDGSEVTVLTDASGKFQFDNLVAGDYYVSAQKSGIGEAYKTVSLVAENGVHIELLLRPPPLPKMFTKERLDDGFAIRGNAEFQGILRPVRVRLAYAAWGGSKSYSSADFSLEEMTISSRGVRESGNAEIIKEPNLLRFTPIERDFYVEVRGFDVNRGLYVDARGIDEPTSDEGVE
jgi:hypothetical protein